MKKIRCFVLQSVCIVALLTITFVLVLVINSFVRHWQFENWYLGKQPFTTWISEDGTIEINVETYGDLTVTIKLEDETIQFNDATFVGYNHTIVMGEGDEQNKILVEWWSCKFKTKNKFVATIDKSTYFQEGQKIVFNKVE